MFLGSFKLRAGLSAPYPDRSAVFTQALGRNVPVSRLLAIMALLLIGCGVPDTPSDVRMAAAEFAPGIELGARAEGAGHPRYRWAFAPYTGYSDTTYAGHRGFGRISLRVDEMLVNEEDAPSPGARILSFSVSTADPQAAARAESRLTTLLGEPEVLCYWAEPEQIARLVRWPRKDDRGVVLVVPAGEWTFPAGLTFGWNAKPEALRSRSVTCPPSAPLAADHSAAADGGPN